MCVSIYNALSDMCPAQTDDLLPSGSDFVTSSDESGGTKAQRRRTSKDKPKKSRMKQGGTSGELDSAMPGTTCKHRACNVRQGVNNDAAHKQDLSPQRGYFATVC